MTTAAAIAIAITAATFVVLVARSPAPPGAGEGSSAPAPAPPPPGAAVPGAAETAAVATRCPWLASAMGRHESDAALAHLVVGRMTLDEKLGEIVLDQADGFENIDSGVPRLCIPALTLQDGTEGVAFRAVDVTQLPSPLGIAASFDPPLARAYGEVQGNEAGGQGIDVVQGPDLNVDRVPESGRTFEGFGEDPLLVSDMGVADIEGIQSTGALAMAKHFAVYSQETDRGALDDVVSERALQEIYLPPFKAAVTRAHVSTVMCAYPRLNGTYQCQDPQLQTILEQWGFTGLVRSDLGAVHDPVAALTAGTDLIKPARVHELSTLVGEHQLSMAAVDAAATRVVTLLFATGQVGTQQAGSPDADVATDADTDFALQAAQRSAVLLKDSGSVLPLDPSPSRSLAVIGADADPAPVTTGYGSSRVLAPFTSVPLDAIRHRVGTGEEVSYVNGGSTTKDLPPVPSDLLTPVSGGGHGLTLTLFRTDPGTETTSATTTGQSMQTVEPTADLSLRPHPVTSRRLSGSSAAAGAVELPHRPTGTGTGELSLGSFGSRASVHRTRIVLPAGWSDAKATLTGTLTPRRTGLYTVSIQGDGSAELTLDGVPAVSDLLVHGPGRWSQTVSLRAGHAYRVDLAWDPIDTTTPTGEAAVVPSNLSLGWEYVSDQIAEAARAASRADTAVVFAGDFNSEAFDRPSLSLPGDENALISAVAAANRRTVVVLNTGGPVLMPWLGRVAAVIEDWYPGEQDGTAIAALLYGDVDPSGRLPVTFPQSEAASPVSTATQWPGVDLVSTYSEGLEVGYRYNQATGVRPLFPFGFGLAYTRFRLGGLTTTRTTGGYSLGVVVTNTGRRSGTAVPQAYLTYPTDTGEPPDQLVAFRAVTLGPGQSRTVRLTVPASSFATYLNGSWTTVPGTYTVSVGQSSASHPLSATLPAP